MYWRVASVKRQTLENVVSLIIRNRLRTHGRERGVLFIIVILIVIVGFIWSNFTFDTVDPEERKFDIYVGIDTSQRSSVGQVPSSYSGGDCFSNVRNVCAERNRETYSVEWENLVGKKQCADKLNWNSSVRSERVIVERCVDGDTLVVVNSSGNRERVRLIGANTPETVKPNWPVEPFGSEASAYTKRRISEAGNVVTLVSDGPVYDRYKRRLAFIYLENVPVSLNEELCRQGLAVVETRYHYSKEMKKRLSEAAKEAKKDRLGIYSLPLYGKQCENY